MFMHGFTCVGKVAPLMKAVCARDSEADESGAWMGLEMAYREHNIDEYDVGHSADC